MSGRRSPATSRGKTSTRNDARVGIRGDDREDGMLPTLDDIRAAATAIRGTSLRTPLVRLDATDDRLADQGLEGYLKLENLQPIGAFKIRGAANVMAHASREDLSRGVVTASAGNMAQGVAWQARRLRVPCTVIAPDHAPVAKRHAVERLGARLVLTPF